MVAGAPSRHVSTAFCCIVHVICVSCNPLHNQLLLQGANAACCTNGQPSYEDSGYLGKFPIPTCSDGPCSGEEFSYSGEGAYESPNPLSCCDVENLGQFKYNPQDGTGKYWPWPNDKHFPELLEGTGQPCDPEAVRFRCKLGGHVSWVGQRE
jgi:hypothetical protein